jgi:Fe-S cluster biogenesis protein NfuA
MRSKEEIIEDIEQIVVSKIQPTVAMHGGVVSLHSFNDGVATMFMSGACSGCSSSTETLKIGIENMLTFYVPEVSSVEGVDDPNSGVDPYHVAEESSGWSTPSTAQIGDLDSDGKVIKY